MTEKQAAALRARQGEILGALATAPLNKVEKLQGRLEGLVEAEKLLLDLIADKEKESDE